jgi:hypothetical protein
MKKVLLTGVAALSVLSASVAAEPDALGCFTRTYDRAHLARHPDQRITEVKLRVYKEPPDEGKSIMFEAQFKVRVQGNCKARGQMKTPVQFRLIQMPFCGSS